MYSYKDRSGKGKISSTENYINLDSDVYTFFLLQEHPPQVSENILKVLRYFLP